MGLPSRCRCRTRPSHPVPPGPGTGNFNPRPLDSRLSLGYFRIVRGCSSAGRALEWHSRGQGFNSPQLHQGNQGGGYEACPFFASVSCVQESGTKGKGLCVSVNNGHLHRPLASANQTAGFNLNPGKASVKPVSLPNRWTASDKCSCPQRPRVRVGEHRLPCSLPLRSLTPLICPSLATGSRRFARRVFPHPALAEGVPSPIPQPHARQNAPYSHWGGWGKKFSAASHPCLACIIA